MVVRGRPFLRCPARTHLGLLAARPAHRTSPHAAHGLSAPARERRALDIRPDGGRDVGGRRPDADCGSRGPRVSPPDSHELITFCFASTPRGSAVVRVLARRVVGDVYDLPDFGNPSPDDGFDPLTQGEISRAAALTAAA